jgi:hypothetical protein
MKSVKTALIQVLFIVILGIGLFFAEVGFAQDKAGRNGFQDGLYIELTESFYRALRGEAERDSVTYTTEMRNEHLRQIAVSARFMVETNLQIIRQQEQMIRLLDAIDKHRK